MGKNQRFCPCYNNGVAHRLVFMGSPDFAVPSLRALAEQYTLSGVVTQPDRPAGRGGAIAAPAVKQAALELGLPLIQPEKLRAPEAMEQLHAWSPDAIVVAAFGQILRPEVLGLPRFGCVNVHASLLPRWRGAAPVQAALLAGDTETGITIMQMDAGIDTGPILAQRGFLIEREATAGTLLASLSTLGAHLLLETLPRYLAGEIRPQSQPAEGASYAPMLKKEDGKLDFALPAEVLSRQARALNPWPGAFFELEGAQVKVLRAHATTETGSDLPAGTRLTLGKAPCITTGEGLLILDELQPPGKKPMSGKAFLAGARWWTRNESDG
jgi:methionyl-tRNA formyltransferase